MMNITNLVLRFQWTRPLADPPWNYADFQSRNFARPLGGQVLSISADRKTVGVSDSLTAGKHQREWMVVLSGSDVWSLYRIEDNTASALILFQAASSNLAMNDWVGIAEDLSPKVVEFSVNRSRWAHKAILNISFVEGTKVERMDVLCVRQEKDGRWQTLGWFLVEDIDSGLRREVVVTAPDLLHLGDLDLSSDAFQADLIFPHRRISPAAGKSQDDMVVVLSKFTEGSQYAFYQGLGGAANLNHTDNWATDPPPILWISSNSNDSISSSDYRINLGQDPVEVLYGQGKILADKAWFDGKGTYLKAQYAYYAHYRYTILGKVETVGAVGGNIQVSNAYYVQGYNEFPATGERMKGMTLRFRTGKARGFDFVVQDNTANTLTFAPRGGITASDIAPGDLFEVQCANYPHQLVERMARNMGFMPWIPGQMPLQINLLKEVLIRMDADVIFYDASAGTYTNISSQAQDDTTQKTLLIESGDALYIGYSLPFYHIELVTYASGTGVSGFSISILWPSAISTFVEEDETENWKHSGLIRFIPFFGANYWPVVNDSTFGNLTGKTQFWVKVSFTGGTTLYYKAIAVQSRINAKPAWSFAVEDEITHNRALERMLQDDSGKSILPPNYNWYVNPDGKLMMDGFTQGPPTKEIRRIISLARSTQEEVATSVLVLGEMQDRQDYALASMGALITSTWANTAPGTDPVAYWSDARGPSVIIDGEIKDVSPLAWYNSHAGAERGKTGGWGLAANNEATIKNQILWQVDLGSVRSEIEEVRLRYWHRTPGEGNRWTVFTLEVSTDGSVWVPLSTNARRYTSPTRTAFVEDVWTENEAGWQSSFRYIRFILNQGWWREGKYLSPTFQELIVSSGFIHKAQVTIGDDPPFNTTYYQSLKRKLGKRTKVWGPLPFRNKAAMVKFAKQLLRSLVSMNDPWRIESIDGFTLGETVRFLVNHPLNDSGSLEGVVVEMDENSNGLVSIVLVDYNYRS